eukprot:TRINITY_DN63254_c0_g1_i1.p1 TRINITY_DN63254_c0_g1~~TRINITY_DN63254_c0_g1_i1.p1  ORF type:complete len:288 (-),score=40.26 TRINITY_DN63254_c0_g1_i1:85-948(-)
MDPRRGNSALMPFQGPGPSMNNAQMQNPFQMMDAMMSQMMGPCGGDPFGGGMFPFGGGMCGGMGNMVAMSSCGGAMGGMGGGFSSQTMCFSSKMGPDGQMHTEQFSSSTVGDTDRAIRETQQAYSNSSTGVDKMSMERQMRDQGRKMVKERSRTTGDERSTEMFRGITEDRAHEFDASWEREAAPHLQPHTRFQPNRLMAASDGRPQFAISGGDGSSAIAGSPTAGAPTASQPLRGYPTSVAGAAQYGAQPAQHQVGYGQPPVPVRGSRSGCSAQSPPVAGRYSPHY